MLKLQWAKTSPFESPAYRAWRRDFLRHRLRLGFLIAIPAYATFITLRLILAAVGVETLDPSWLIMASSSELGLILCLLLRRTRVGRQHPEFIFLGASWSITLVEQIWATLQGFAFPGMFSWTLVFLAQATLLPMRWQLHLISQLGVLVYHYGVNTLLGFTPVDQPLWDLVRLLYLFWFCCICDLSVFLYERLQRSEFYARRQLETEQAKSERLLLNILPEAVAEQLKQNQRTIAESFAEVTVLFADIVGFTELSSGIPAAELVTWLNQFFCAFDELAEKHGLEKIKTIGDAYMVVGGLPIECADHAEAIADMALDMLLAVKQFQMQQHQPINIRIGINTGPVVAGVIGSKKFIYDLWGDAVNIASRMESQGLAGCIQVSEATYERLQHQYLFERRGAIDIKGKGKMTTYLLRGKLRSES